MYRIFFITVFDIQYYVKGKLVWRARTRINSRYFTGALRKQLNTDFLARDLTKAMRQDGLLPMRELEVN
jgi:hypothetical protein